MSPSHHLHRDHAGLLAAPGMLVSLVLPLPFPVCPEPSQQNDSIRVKVRSCHSSVQNLLALHPTLHKQESYNGLQVLSSGSHSFLYVSSYSSPPPYSHHAGLLTAPLHSSTSKPLFFLFLPPDGLRASTHCLLDSDITLSVRFP